MAKKIIPVSIWGIEFDALIDQDETLTSTIPTYPVEEGFPVSDTIINDPISLQLTLFVSCTPVTWLYRHGNSTDRVRKICDQIEAKWYEKKLAKIVTSDAVFANMGITSINIKKAQGNAYSRQITVSARRVVATKRKTVSIPKYVLKAGETMANAGKASTSKSSSSSGASGGAGNSGSSSGNSNSSKSSSSGSESSAKKSQSILYGAAKNLNFI